jgi:hypothetical protein
VVRSCGAGGHRISYEPASDSHNITSVASGRRITG